MPLDSTTTRDANADWPLTGRDTTVHGVSSALSAGRGIVLAGPAGVGKTRLLDECLARLPRDTVTMRFAATEVTGRLPFGALATLLPTGVVLGRDRVDLFRAVAAELAGAGRPLVLAVDDAHLLDVAGLALLHHLVREEVAAAALTVRTRQPRADRPARAETVGVAGVVDTQRATGLEWLDVPPLEREDLAELLAAALGAPVERDTVVVLDEFSGGDLVLLREVLLHARSAGQLVRSGGVWRLEGRPPVGQRLALLVDDRLGRLPAGVRAAAEAVALTEPLPVALLGRAAPIEAVMDAERAGLVRVEEQGGRSVVRCTHPLYAEVLRRQVPALRLRGTVAGAGGHRARAARGHAGRRAAGGLLVAGQPHRPRRRGRSGRGAPAPGGAAGRGAGRPPAGPAARAGVRRRARHLGGTADGG